MKLFEFEGHRVLNKVGIQSPFFVVCSDLSEVEQARKRIKFPIVAKVQVLVGKRGKGGGVKVCASEKQLMEFVNLHLGNEFGGEKVRFIALFEKVEIEKEHYFSISYDTVFKSPFILYSRFGGIDIEEVDRDSILKLPFDVFDGPSRKDLAQLGVPSEFVLRLWDAFWRYDLRLLEINPVAQVGDEFIAIDAKVILDDAGLLRQKDLDVLPKGSLGAVPSERERLAKQIDAEDYRGSAGSSFLEFDGDIAILASGGGASLLVMDSLMFAGGKAANYTEYSGNPPREKVEALTKITLSKEGLSGCLVAGAVANFTDIYETLGGFIDGLRQVKPKPIYPIVIRRGGPRQKEAYEEIKKIAEKEGFDIHLFGPETPISVAVKKMVELSNIYKQKHGDIS